MRGRPPKDPALRRGHGAARKAPALELSAATLVGDRRPELPRRARAWHPLTVAWWDDVWSSPMARRFLEVDVHALYIVAELVDMFWSGSGPSPRLSAELRRWNVQFGLEVFSRRRLGG
jgi:hypothetical protein